jgi:hypothetical protein
MDYTKVPAHIINKYLWDLAKGYAGDIKVPDEVFGTDVLLYPYMPFFPLTENTSKVNTDLPFIIYQSMPRLKYDTDYWIKSERMFLTVVAPMPNVMYIANFISHNTSKEDRTAKLINDYTGDNAVIFDRVTSYTVNLPQETTDFVSATPRFQAEIIVDFDYRRADGD